jgi:translation initiation factor IF-3
MIRAPKIRLIGSAGEQLGLYTPESALKMAEDEGLDLVEISPKSDPPVCKIMDYGKYKYEQQKKLQESKKKQTVTVVKEIKLRPTTDQHDLEFKMKHVRRFIEDKDKAKITIQFRGREMAYVERAKATLNKIVADLIDIAVAESSPKVEGRTLSVILAPK